MTKGEIVAYNFQGISLSQVLFDYSIGNVQQYMEIVGTKEGAWGIIQAILGVDLFATGMRFLKKKGIMDERYLITEDCRMAIINAVRKAEKSICAIDKLTPSTLIYFCQAFDAKYGECTTANVNMWLEQFGGDYTIVIEELEEMIQCMEETA